MLMIRITYFGSIVNDSDYKTWDPQGLYFTSFWTCVRGIMLKSKNNVFRCASIRTWCNVPRLGRSYPINNLIAGAILFTGASVAKSLRLCSVLNIARPSESTVNYIQRHYLHGVSNNLLDGDISHNSDSPYRNSNSLHKMYNIWFCTITELNYNYT
jgi:hypothetical protein